MKKQFYMGILFCIVVLCALVYAVTVIKNVPVSDATAEYYQKKAVATGSTMEAVAGTNLDKVATMEQQRELNIEKMAVMGNFTSLIDQCVSKKLTQNCITALENVVR